MDLMGQTPAHSLTIEPIHILDQHEMEKTYSADSDKFHWNFGVGFKNSINHPNFNILDNDYIKVTGLQYRDDNDKRGPYFKVH